MLHMYTSNFKAQLKKIIKTKAVRTPTASQGGFEHDQVESITHISVCHKMPHYVIFSTRALLFPRKILNNNQ